MKQLLKLEDYRTARAQVKKYYELCVQRSNKIGEVIGYFLQQGSFAKEALLSEMKTEYTPANADMKGKFIDAYFIMDIFFCWKVFWF